MENFGSGIKNSGSATLDKNTIPTSLFQSCSEFWCSWYLAFCSFCNFPSQKCASNRYYSLSLQRKEFSCRKMMPVRMVHFFLDTKQSRSRLQEYSLQREHLIFFKTSFSPDFIRVFFGRHEGWLSLDPGCEPDRFHNFCYWKIMNIIFSCFFVTNRKHIPDLLFPVNKRTPENMKNR